MRTLYHTILLLVAGALLALLAACKDDGKSFSLSGDVEGMNEGEIYIYSLVAEAGRFDTVKVSDGSFSYNASAEMPTPFCMIFQNGIEQVFIAGPGDKLEYKAKMGDLKNFTVEGNEENELIEAFRELTDGMSEKSAQIAAAEFIEKNTATAAALYLFDKYYVQSGELSSSQGLKLLEMLGKAHSDNPLYMFFSGVAKFSSVCQKGMELPDMTVKDKWDREISLRECHPSKWLVIAAWATWQSGGYITLASMRDTRKKFTSQQMEVLLVSLDTQHEVWKQAVANDSIGIIHCCDDGGWESQYAKSLGIGSLPEYILVDKDNRIVDRCKSPDDMRRMLDKYIK